MKNKGGFLTGLSKNQVTSRDFLKYLTRAGLIASIPVIGCSDPSGPDFPGSNAYASFEITFDKQMDIASVENAISISPNSALSSSVWTNNNTSVAYTFEASDTDTVYTVTIGAAAQDIYSNNLDGNSDGTGGDPYSFTMQGTVVPF